MSDTNDDQPQTRGGAHPFALLLRLIFSPRGGWGAIRRSGISAEGVASRAFYPLLALASASAFFPMIGGDLTLPAAIVSALVVFLSFFIAQFIILPLSSLALPGDEREKISTTYAKAMVPYLLSTLVIIKILWEFLPMLEALLFFAPLYTVYLAFVGCRRLRIDSRYSVRFMITLSLLVVFTPMAIEQLLRMLLPSFK